MGRGKAALKGYNQSKKKKSKAKKKQKTDANPEKASAASDHSHVSSVTAPSLVLQSNDARGVQTSSEIQKVLDDAAKLTEQMQKEASDMKRSVTDNL